MGTTYPKENYFYRWRLGRVAAAVVLLLSTYYFLLTAPQAHAAVLYFDAPEAVSVGEAFEIAVMLDAEGESVNALEGTVLFDAEALTLSSVRTGGSVVPLWVTEPSSEAGAEGAVVFRGIVPGGFNGVAEPFASETKPGRVFALRFTATRQGETTTLSFAHAQVLSSGETGSPVSLDTPPAKLSVTAPSPVAAGERSRDDEEQPDREPPRAFQPVILNDTEFFGGDSVLLFNTHDKESGVAYYELLRAPRALAEDTLSEEQPWTRVKSPYTLSQSEKKHYLYVKAVDYAGNEYIAEVSPQKSRERSPLAVILMVLFIVSPVVYFFAVPLFRRS